MDLTHSDASVIELVLTKTGCKICSSNVLVVPERLIEIPAFFSPFSCLERSSVTTLMLFKPAFSASVVGITSKA